MRFIHRTRSARLAPILTMLVVAAGGIAPASAAGQDVLTRTPNLSGGWVGEPGAIHFNFLHRFRLSSGPGEDVVINTPTFLLAAPLPASAMIGVRYATNSLVVGGEQNEWELLGRWSPLSAGEGDPLDLALTGAYNEAAASADGELSVALPVGPLRLLGTGRVFSDAYGRGEAGWAVGGGGLLRVSDGIALAGDVISASDREPDQALAWSAGAQLRIPLTPHTLSLQATNARTGTLQGSSVGQENASTGEDQIFWGFEFTIPFTFSRYFGGGGGNESAPEAPAPETPADESGRTVVTMTDDLGYAPSTIRVQVGETVIWRNTTRLVHTVTADPGRAQRENSVSLPEGARTFDSGNLRPGESFSHTFEVAGEYVYFCVPHELAGMVGRVVVTR